MGFKFRKSVKIAPGVKLNINSKSVGISAGVKGARISTNTKGRTTTTVGIPGTGISYSNTVNSKRSKNKTISSDQARVQATSFQNPIQEVYSSLSKKYKKPSKDLQKIFSHAANRINQDQIVTFVRGNLNGFMGNAGVLFAMPDRLLHYGDKYAKYEIVEFDYNLIDHVKVKSGLTGYKLIFDYAGKEISVSTIDEGSIDEIFAYIQEKIAEQSNQNMNDVSFSNSNVPEQIRQFAELRDQGIITEEEFAKKKEQLLDIN
ncbi:DUF4236 domain-containing protein [Bacillus velezensis]|uniref:DUF4236 domain-containing protein n=1 Tax=Bacillus amyloliquefaciens group TaxID=1938374 RepID=UPI000397D14E|nr:MULTISPECIES: DUF4236 domain-containing protein [Bacillus amyloliquefaciens group]ERH57933.1 hypothetical protein O205_18270 [Bacillus amyloliquefaciens EGD-AQ14]POI16328.1 DUF4236 domain-containing protein [Bacillus velezensis]QZY39672.1 DUF4236 domain-containing protein [Bacillus velezensis]